MAVAVVETLEAVDVDEGNAQRPLGTRRKRHLPRQRLLPRPAIAEAGQRIAEGQVAHLGGKMSDDHSGADDDAGDEQPLRDGRALMDETEDDGIKDDREADVSGGDTRPEEVGGVKRDEHVEEGDSG